MLQPLDLSTETLAEQANPVQNETEYVKQLRSKMKAMYTLLRENLQKASERQKKHYDCRVKEHNYQVGDLIWRNQKQCLTGLKATILRHWTGPCMINGKLCDVLFWIQHSKIHLQL